MAAERKKMILKKLTFDHPDIPAVNKLYEEAFPERVMTMDDVLKLTEHLPIELLGIYPDETPDTFAGFFLTTCLLIHGRHTRMARRRTLCSFRAATRMK